MRIILFAVLAIAPALASSSFAADMRAAQSAMDGPAYVQSWTGAYGGFSAGGIHNFVNATGQYGSSAAEWQYAGSSAFASFNIGFNIQRNSTVYGLEADYGFANAAGDSVYSQDGYGVYDKYVDKITSLGTVRARLGYAFGPTLVYLTGGFAYGEVAHSRSYYDPSYDFSKSGFQMGWAAGAGAEYALTPSISITGQFLYADLGATKVTAHSGEQEYEIANQEYAVTAGLKYRIGGGSSIAPK
jgi:outer membrane immunogenic protein